MTLQVVGLHTSGIMSHLDCISPPTRQQEGYLHYDAPIPWELTPFCISWSPYTFPSGPLEDHVQIPELDQDHFHQLLESIQHQILSMAALTTTLEKSDRAYDALRDSPKIEIFINHQPCWGTCIIYDIPDEEFLQNLIRMLSRPNFIWRIIIDAFVTPFVVRFIKLCRPWLLHLEEDLFDYITIAYLLSINHWFWDFLLSLIIPFVPIFISIISLMMI